MRVNITIALIAVAAMTGCSDAVVLSPEHTFPNAPRFETGTVIGNNVYIQQPVSHNLAIGSTLALKAIWRSSGQPVYMGMTWVSSNPAVATVTILDGVVTGVSVGRAWIQVTQTTLGRDSTYIDVVPSTSTFTVSPAASTLAISQTVQLTNTSLTAVTWSSSNPAIATVNATGLVSGVGAGTAIITALNSGGSTATATVTVTVPLTVTVTPSSSTVQPGQTVQLTSSIATGVVWTSSNAAIATVSATGLVTGVADGVATITATVSSVGSATAAITVSSTFTLTPATAAVLKGQTVQLTTSATSAITWSTSNSAVATVTSSGLVAGTGVGTATITARNVGGTTRTSTITVTNTLSVTPVTPTVQTGQTVQLASNSPTSVTWTTSNGAIATVSAAGLVTGMAAGTAVVTATNAAGNTGVSNVTVVAPPPPTSTTVELPRVTLDALVASARAAVPARTINVSTSAALQAAIDTSKFGDDIVLQTGATFTGMFTLRNKTTGTGWITIRGAGAIPAPGVRARPSTSAGWPKIVSHLAAGEALLTDLGAHHYRITGVEITVQPTFANGYSMVSLGNGGSAQNTVAKIAHDLVIDRVYIHGAPTYNFQRCIQLNSASTAIVDSWISECHGKGYDSQAIGGWNGPGPYLINNNYLEGAGENVMFGGAGPSIVGQLPSDITITRNHIFKPATWAGGVWTVKNLFELKLGIRVLFEGNILENNWLDAQNGFAVVLNSTNDQQNAPWSETRDVTFQNNIVRNVAHGLNMAGWPNPGTVVPMTKVYIGQNFFDKIGNGTFTGGILWQVGGVGSLTLEHNTGYGRTHGLVLYGSRNSPSLSIKDNAFGTLISMYGTWNFALASAEGHGYGTAALNYHANPWTMTGNVLPPGVQASVFPSGNLFSTVIGTAGVNQTTLATKTAGVVVQP